MDLICCMQRIVVGNWGCGNFNWDLMSVGKLGFGCDLKGCFLFLFLLFFFVCIFV